MSKIKIMALGGLGENGKNSYVVEVDNKLFILDAGIKYPDIDMYGVDSVIADIEYLKANKDNIQGIFVSHGHEDNSGAVPFLLNNLHTKVYGSHFTISLIEASLKSHNMNVSDYKLYRINANKVMKFGDVKVSFFNTTHSIPESMGITFETPDGVIVYCTDFNFGVSSDGTYQTTFDKITQLGKSKVLALLSESRSAAIQGRISNESLLISNLNNILIHHHDRIIIGAYSTDLIRIQKAIDLSVASGRKVAVVSCDDQLLIDVAMESGYLRIPEEACFNVGDYTKEQLDLMKDIVIFVTGYREEPYHSLVSMAMGEEELINFKETDKVVLMCPPVPGTERQTTDAINALYQYDTDLTIFDKKILRSAHASPDDLKMLYAMVKPEYIIPIKGEYRHMYSQMRVALEAGFERDHIILLDNGEQIIFNDGVLDETHNIFNIGDLYIDKTSVGVVNEDTLAERNKLAEEGVVFIYGAVDLRKRAIVNNITLSTKGFSYSLSEDELTASLGGLMERIVNNYLKKKTWNLTEVEDSLKEELSKVVFRYTKHRPIIVPVILEIK